MRVSKAIPAALAVFAAVALAPTAAAKGPVALQVCGATGCKTIRDDFSGGGPNRGPISGILNSDMLDFAASPPPAAYYRVELKADWIERDPAFYVPAAGVLRVGSNWLALPDRVAASMRAVTRRLAPWPPPALTRVLVNGRPVPDPAPYAALLGSLPEADKLPTAARYLTIVLRADRPSPWTSVRPLEYFPRSDLLHRYVEWLEVPAAIARRIERDAGLIQPPQVTTSSGRKDVAAALAVVGAVSVLGLALTLSRRRSRALAS